MAELWEVIALAQMMSDKSDDEEKQEVDQLLVSYAVEVGKAFSNLESYALELKMNEFEDSRTLEIYRIVRSSQFDNMGGADNREKEYDRKNDYASVFRRMIALKRVELECCQSLAEACNSQDLSQLDLCIAKAQRGREDATKLMGQVRQIAKEVEVKNKKDTVIRLIILVIVGTIALIVYFMNSSGG